MIAEGEVHQLLTSNDTETGEAAYLEVIKGKTAQLFSAAAEVGAVESADAAGGMRTAKGKDPDGYGVALLEYADYAKELSV